MAVQQELVDSAVLASVWGVCCRSWKTASVKAAK